MTVRIRADLEQLPGYVPGRSIPGAVKLASNEVPQGPLPSVVEAVAAAAGEINRYPDNFGSALVAELSSFLDVPAPQLAIGCGSVSLCQQLVQATCTRDDEVLFGWRSFEAYPVLAHVVGARQVRVPLDAGFGLDLRAMAEAITPATRLVFLCNPNNPTGTAVRRAELEEFLDRVPEDTLVVLDEAYREFVTDPDVPDGIRLAEERFAKGRHNIAVLRTFSKAYGLAGLRVGYCYATGTIAEALRKVYVPFSVNAPAQAAAIASLRAHDQLMDRCAALVVERERVRTALTEAGYTVPDTQANFVWLPLGERTEAFNEHCLTHKIVVRPFAADGARVTIGTPEENDVFLAAARSFTG
ncbi:MULTISPECIES: histidinol-phosphate transaminase [Actinoalloteichus]|uniref:Aromatic amino acid aminotransferase n=1 Tax=Actinoalloteichus fjordicus TaxID=1612552 RepID=A0AAC9L7E0_9PSEU|nr:MULTISPECIES: histidinol-phosphate transaminase [Actinoalloteichus]APU12256.1 histidinol-phosphate aminotransferase [Actinoalloteichus fjordicus]APU18208.1 histidinol-phosphate aminotransferase [Actinoalloteichus sp. GBA129-24]